jgi:hypothetical protein
MSVMVRALLLILCVSLRAEAQSRTLALYTRPIAGMSSESKQAMQTELQDLLAPSGLEPILKNSSELKAGENFDFVVVGSFEGTCAVDESALAPLSGLDPNVTLGDTSVSEGRILPFFRVECTRIVHMLKSEIEPLAAPLRESLLGRALARIVAHEIYHIVARTADHRHGGLAKAAFSVHDMIAPHLEFDPWSVNRMRPARVDATLTQAGCAAAPGQGNFVNCPAL